MKKLLIRVRRLLRDRRFRRIWMRVISAVACITVFVTTYSLVLPAITMEKEAQCGISAHQHDESCYEERIACGLSEESGHVHDAGCYKKVLVCGYEAHTHSVDCYRSDAQGESAGIESGLPADSSGAGVGSADEQDLSVLEKGGSGSAHEAGSSGSEEKSAQQDPSNASGTEGSGSESRPSGSGSRPEKDEGAAGGASGKSSGEKSGSADRGSSSSSGSGSAASSGGFSEDEISRTGEEDVYFPQLGELDFNEILDKNTGIYYHAVGEGEVISDSSSLTDWTKAGNGTVLSPRDLIRVYISYTIPAGSLNETNPTARYRLPSNLRLSQAQVEAINGLRNGIAAKYVDMDSLTLLDPEAYHNALGAEAIEGSRRPGERTPSGTEFISATVKVQNLYGSEGGTFGGDAIEGSSGPDGDEGLLGQELIFTFTDYTIKKNENRYAADGRPLKAGTKVRGWIVLDFNMSQVVWEEGVRHGKSVRTAQVDFSEGSGGIVKTLVMDDPFAEENGSGEGDLIEGVVYQDADDAAGSFGEGAEGIFDGAAEAIMDAIGEAVSETDGLREDETADTAGEGSPSGEDVEGRSDGEAAGDTESAADGAGSDREGGEGAEGASDGSVSGEAEGASDASTASSDGDDSGRFVLYQEDQEEQTDQNTGAETGKTGAEAEEGREDGAEAGKTGAEAEEGREDGAEAGKTGAEAGEDKEAGEETGEDKKSAEAAGEKQDAEAGTDAEKAAENKEAEAESDSSEAGGKKEEEQEGIAAQPEAPAKPVYSDGTLISEGAGYKITLSYRADARIPENAWLSVHEITREFDAEAYEACLRQARGSVSADSQTTIDDSASRFFDIEILAEETVVLPASENEAGSLYPDGMKQDAAEPDAAGNSSDGIDDIAPSDGINSTDEINADDGIETVDGTDANSGVSEMDSAESREGSDEAVGDGNDRTGLSDSASVQASEGREDAKETEGSVNEQEAVSTETKEAVKTQTRTVKIEPAAPVSVNIQLFDTAAASSAETDGGQLDADRYKVVHFADEGAQEIEATAVQTPADAADLQTSDMDNFSGDSSAADQAEEKSGKAAAGSTKENGGESQNETEEKASIRTTDADGDSSSPELQADSLTQISFEADSFSIYGVVYTVINTYLLSASGEAYEISVSYDEASGIPANAELRVTELTEENKEYANYYTEALKTAASEGASEGTEGKSGASSGGMDEEAAGSTAAAGAGDSSGNSIIDRITGFFGGLLSDSEVEATAAEEAAYARFFDIEIWAGGRKIEPSGQVLVNIRLLDAPDDISVTPKVVHFAQAGTELVASSGTRQEDGEERITFSTGEFSVYSVVYTVDFFWEVNGETYGLTLRGGNAISLSSLVQALHIADDSTYADAGGTGGSEDSIDGEDEEPVASTDVDEVTRDDLAVSWKTRKFIAAVQSVEFSSPELVWVGKIEEDTTVGQVMDANQLLPVYSPGTTDNEFCRMFYRSVAAPDWVLISLKPFSTEESLTITMKDGAQLVVRVTDAADAVLISDGNGGEIVQTITNPAGTTIDLFDYWITNALRDAHGMNGWPGHKDQDQPYDSWSFAAYNYWGREINGGNNPSGETDTDINDYYIVNDQLRGNGNESGINKGHLFKFYPGAAGTVVDRGDKKNGRNDHIRGSNNEWTNNHDKYSSINSWTGTADPTQGLIEKTLVDGYPRLVGGNAGYHLGTVDSPSTANGESLAYLFDNTALDGKQKYGNVNNLLYVDPEGYYTYDSRYYSAEYNKEGAAQGTFTLRKHDIKGDTKHENAIKGFWPFGDRINWHGLHMTAQFSMPANGQVLNPRGEYKDMQFEFSGDDDTWLFIDGVLVGDGGGIHNRTEIDVNFATGKVTVTGRKDDNHMGQFEEVQWLDDIFKAQNRYVDADWEDIPGVSGHKRMKSGTHHTFEMFYLERGGSESNLYIHYNLVSTADFTAHKSYYGMNADERLGRDQFRFELVGFDGKYDSNGQLVDPDAPAIMPTGGSDTGAGTVASPRKVHNSGSGGQPGYTSYVTGVTEDGNVNFGMVDISSEEMHACDEYHDHNNGYPSTYRYMIREIVPDDAKNAFGKTWDQATEAERAEGGFVKNGITYDGRVYYWTGTVRRKKATKYDGTTYYVYDLKKTRYTDETFTEEDTKTKFFSFTNGYVHPLTLQVIKKSSTGRTLAGAEFSLSSAVKTIEAGENENAVSVRWKGRHNARAYSGQTDYSGLLSFPGLSEGNYILEETQAPDGYLKSTPSRWLVTLSRKEIPQSEQTQGSLILEPVLTPLDADGNVLTQSEGNQNGAGLQPVTLSVALQNSENGGQEYAAQFEVVNTRIPRGDISVTKKWLKADGVTEYTAEELQQLDSDVQNVVISGKLYRRYDNAPNSGGQLEEAVMAPGSDSDIFTLTSENNWKVTWTSADLYEGDFEYVYYFRDVTESASGGFSFVDVPVLSVNNGKSEYAFRNIEITYGEVEFDKKNTEGEPVDGAVFSLYTDAACTEPLTANGQPVTAASENGGHVKITASRTVNGAEKTGIPVGNYYMKETSAPDGYRQSDQKYYVHVGSGEAGDPSFIAKAEEEPAVGNLSLEEYYRSKPVSVIENEPLRIIVKKVDGDGFALAGAKFTLRRTTQSGGGSSDYDGYGLTMPAQGETDNGIYEFGNLVNGSYTLQETAPQVPDQVPVAYEAVNDIIFTVENHQINIDVSGRNDLVWESDTLTLTVKNEPLVNNGNITVRKQWLDFFGNVDNPAVGQVDLILKRKKDVPRKKYLNVIVEVKGKNNRYKKKEAVFEIVQNNVKLYWNDESQFYWDRNRISVNANGLTYSDETRHHPYDDAKNNKDAIWYISNLDSVTQNPAIITFTYNLQNDALGENDWFFNDVINFTTIKADWYGNSIQTGDGNPQPDNDFQETLTLNAANNWMVNKTVGGTKDNHDGYDYPAADQYSNAYHYYIEETQLEGYAAPEYSENNDSGIQSGVLTAYNRKTSVDFPVVKVDGADSSVKLEGARFEARQIKKDVSVINYIGEVIDPETGGTGHRTGEDGVSTFKGLEVSEGGSYYEIKEAEVPPGYVVTGDGAFYIKITEEGIFRILKSSGPPSSWPVASNDGRIIFANGTATVANTPGAALPHTGGPGTRHLCFVGALLTVFAAVELVMMRRRKKPVR